MPRIKPEKSGTGVIGGAKATYGMIRGLSISEIESEIKQPPEVLVVSKDPHIEDLIAELTGVRGTPSITFATIDQLPKSFDRFALVMVYNPTSNSDFQMVRDLARVAAHLTVDISGAIEPTAIGNLRDRVAETMGKDAVALGRWYPAFRTAAAKAVINDTSRQNAQFAVLSAAPTMIPVLGELASVGADFFILTRNQMLMAVKLAAIYGKPLDNTFDIVKDLVPVIGTGFVWRSLAREAVGFLPFAAGLVPKVGIAYGGTMATGRAIETYYRFGKEVSKEQLSDLFRQGIEAARRRFPDNRELSEQSPAIPPG